MDELVLEGKVFIKATKAAKNLGYATDYVGQLCRSGKIDAHLIGRTWYVNETQLSTHRVEKKRMSRVKARAFAKKSIEEQKTKTQKDQNIYKNIDIRYETDTENLIPELKKDSLGTEKKSEKIEVEKTPETKVVESEVHQVALQEDKPNATETTQNATEGHLEANPVILEVKEMTEEPKTSAKRISAGSTDIKPRFIERLERENILHAVPVQHISDDLPQQQAEVRAEQTIQPKKKQIAGGLYAIIILITLLGTLTTIPFSSVTTYSLGNNSTSKTFLKFSIERAIDNIRLKI